MKSYRHIWIIVLSLIVACGSDQKKPQKFSTILTRQRINTNPHTFENQMSDNCENYAIIISHSKLAKKLKRSKDWVVANYEIPMHADTLTQDKRIIGHVTPGGHCFIVKQEGLWFYLQSSGSNELGWIRQEYVVGFIKKDPETLQPCIG